MLPRARVILIGFSPNPQRASAKIPSVLVARAAPAFLPRFPADSSMGGEPSERALRYICNDAQSVTRGSHRGRALFARRRCLSAPGRCCCRWLKGSMHRDAMHHSRGLFRLRRGPSSAAASCAGARFCGCPRGEGLARSIRVVIHFMDLMRPLVLGCLLWGIWVIESVEDSEDLLWLRDCWFLSICLDPCFSSCFRVFLLYDLSRL